MAVAATGDEIGVIRTQFREGIFQLVLAFSITYSPSPPPRNLPPKPRVVSSNREPERTHDVSGR
jgi:hypothetical protein